MLLLRTRLLCSPSYTLGWAPSRWSMQICNGRSGRMFDGTRRPAPSASVEPRARKQRLKEAGPFVRCLTGAACHIRVAVLPHGRLPAPAFRSGAPPKTLCKQRICCTLEANSVALRGARRLAIAPALCVFQGQVISCRCLSARRKRLSV